MNRKEIPKKKFSIFAEGLIENLPIGMMLLDKNGTIIRMNKKQEETSQIAREKIIGKSFEEAFPSTLRQGVKEPYSRLLRDGTPFDIIIHPYLPQYYLKRITYRAKGSSFSSGEYYILLHEHAVELGYEKRLVERRTKELQESQNFFQSLIDSSPNIVISTDLSERILFLNKTAEKIFGYRGEDVIKRKIKFLFKEVPFRVKNKHHPIPPEILCVKKDQSSFPASFRVSDVKNADGKSVAKLYLLNDLTEKKEMEERLFLSEQLALYSELMGGIAHQLNNPLIGVVNFSEMLLKEMEEEDPKRELAQTISRAGKECLKIITSVLNSIKNPYLTFSKIDLGEVLSDSVNALRQQLDEKIDNVSVKTVFDEHILPIVGDGVQLKQCFLNILTNAIQAMGKGGNLIIKTKYDESKGLAHITFSDTGSGIPQEFKSKIFLPFFSLQKDRNRHGLGLSFAYQIIKNHGGHISVDSTVGKGSVFKITLPVS